MVKKAPEKDEKKHLNGEFAKLDYWHGLLPNEDTANLLKTDGDFLLRGVIKDQDYFIILSIRWGKDVLNTAVIENRKGGWSLQEHNYDTIKEAIDMHQVTKTPLTICGITCTLDTPIRRKAWELRQQMIKLGKELGQGSYGTVYTGTLMVQRQKVIKVAVKVLSEMTAEASNSLWKEARYHQSFDHPNVVKMYGVANDVLPYYLVMELVRGGSLDKYLIKKAGKLRVKERINMLLDAAKGLAYLHDKGTIHRDVAARNLLIDDDVVKVADFGMSRKCNSYKVDTNKPLNLRWLAPEVYKKQTVNKSTDVYAFGVTMYEVFVDPYRIPYEEWDANKVFDEVIEGTYKLTMPDSAPAYIKQLFGECIGVEEERPSFKTIVVCLTNFQEGKGERGLADKDSLVFPSPHLETSEKVSIKASGFRREAAVRKTSYKMVLNTIFGKTDPRFAEVEQVFKKNFLKGWEVEGAAVAVYYHGELVVDLQGGYQDASSGTRWTEGTRVVIFSVTKAVASLVIAMLVDRGKLKYEQKIVEFWPQFGQEGKEDITVDMIMHHQAGLCLYTEPITLEVASDPKAMAKIIEKQRPVWTPGAKTGYHAVSFGWLVDQIVRHVDERGRGMSDYIREEISEPHKIDFFMGLPKREQHTVARLALPTTSYLWKEVVHDPRILIALACLNFGGSSSIKKQANNIDFISTKKGVNSFNNPDLHRLEQPAALGITKARDLGRMFSLMLDGTLLSKEMLKKFDFPRIIQQDVSLKVPTAKGHGFMYERHPYKEGKYLYGHPGYGGSTVMIDPEDQIIIVYLTNGLKVGGGELTQTYKRLRNQILKCIGQKQKPRKDGVRSV